MLWFSKPIRAHFLDRLFIWGILRNIVFSGDNRYPKADTTGTFYSWWYGSTRPSPICRRMAPTWSNYEEIDGKHSEFNGLRDQRQSVGVPAQGESKEEEAHGAVDWVCP